MKDKTEPVRDSIAQALESVTRKSPATRSIDPFATLLQYCTVLNQWELAGMFIAVDSSSQLPVRCNADTIYIEAMKYIVRTKQQEALKIEIEFLKPGDGRRLAWGS